MISPSLRFFRKLGTSTFRRRASMFPRSRVPSSIPMGNRRFRGPYIDPMSRRRGLYAPRSDRIVWPLGISLLPHRPSTLSHRRPRHSRPLLRLDRHRSFPRATTTMLFRPMRRPTPPRKLPPATLARNAATSDASIVLDTTMQRRT